MKRFYFMIVLMGTFAFQIQAVGSLLFDNKSNEPINVAVLYSATSLACSNEKIPLAPGKSYLLKRGWTNLKGYCEIDNIEFTDDQGSKFEVLNAEFGDLPSGDGTLTITGQKGKLNIQKS